MMIDFKKNGNVLDYFEYISKGMVELNNSNKTNTMKVVIYSRVSTQLQDYKRQTEELSEYSQKMGYTDLERHLKRKSQVVRTMKIDLN